MNQTVLVGTDLGEWGDLAIAEADAWARELSAPLIVVHSVSEHTPFPPPWSPLIAEHESTIQLRIDEARAAVAARVERLTGRMSEAEVRIVVVAGTPAAELIRAAEAHHATLLVVGARAASGLQRLLPGRTAEKVVRHAHCPVLVVRSRRRTGHVLVATDLSPHAGLALRAAAGIAARRHARLSALYVIDTGFASPIELGPTPADAPSSARKREHAEAQLREHIRALGVQAEVLVADGRGASSIEHATRDLAVDLVVIGHVGRTGVPRLLLGNTAESILRDTSCSVLVMRGDG